MRSRLVARGVCRDGEPYLLHQLISGRAVSNVALEVTPSTRFVAAIKYFERVRLAARVAAYQRLVTLSRVHSSGVWHVSWLGRPRKGIGRQYDRMGLNDAHCYEIVEAVITNPDDFIRSSLESLEFNVDHE